jgi:hypothetical protein
MKWRMLAKVSPAGGDDTESVSLRKEAPILEEEVLETGHTTGYE